MRIPQLIYEMTVSELARPHRFAQERVGFLAARVGNAGGEQQYLLFNGFRAVPDNDYVQDRKVGARINANAIRSAVQWGLDTQSGIFHVHLHPHRGTPVPSGTDRLEIPRLMPAFRAVIHAVDIYPTLAALAGASTAKCKPLDGVDVWDTIARGEASPRKEIVYNVEPFRGAVRQGDWKLVWRTLLPSRVELFDLARDPSEKNNLAARHPEKVDALQQRLNALAEESAKPLFLVDQFKVVLKGMHGEPILPIDEDYAQVDAP